MKPPTYPLGCLPAVGANYWVPNLASLAKDGRLVLLGLLSGGDVPQVSLRLALSP
jgi:NADPH:quinone reductase-like Zn-dependent oxidoreductase